MNKNKKLDGLVDRFARFAVYLQFVDNFLFVFCVPCFVFEFFGLFSFLASFGNRKFEMINRMLRICEFVV